MKERKNPIQKRSIASKEEILKASFTSLFYRGYKKTTTIKIANDLNISIGAVYIYFNNKEELLKLYLESLQQKFDNYLKSQFKLISYNVEIQLIVGNILEKIFDEFFVSPLWHDSGKFIENEIKNFFNECVKIFFRNCNQNNLFIKHPNEYGEIIVSLVKNYSLDRHKGYLNQEFIKKGYVKIIISLLN